MSPDPLTEDGRAEPVPSHLRDVRLGSGTAWGVGSQAIGVGTSFLVGVLVARLLGVDGKGELAVVMQVVGMMLVVLNFGISNANVYYVAKGLLAPGTAVGNAALMAVLLGVLGAPVVVALLYGQFAVLPGVSVQTVGLAALSVPLGLLAAWLVGVASGLGNLRLGFLFALASSLATLAALGVLALASRIGIAQVVATSVLGSVAGIVVLLGGMRAALRPVKVDVAAARMIGGYSGRTYLAGLAGHLHNRVDVLLLGWLAGAGAVGLYSVGVSLAEFVWYVPSAVGGAILAKAPRSSDASAHDYVARSTRVVVLFMLVVSVTGAILVPLLIRPIYGSAFGPSTLAFYLLLPGAFASGAVRPVWSYFASRERILWREATGTMVLNVALNLLLIPRVGFAGAALASSASYVVLTVIALLEYVRATGTRVSALLVPTRADVRIAVLTLRETTSALLSRRNS